MHDESCLASIIENLTELCRFAANFYVHYAKCNLWIFDFLRQLDTQHSFVFCDVRRRVGVAEEPAKPRTRHLGQDHPFLVDVGLDVDFLTQREHWRAHRHA